MKIDIQRLSQDRRALEARIRSLKALLRTTWTEPMADTQRSLIACKREATELCILRAHLRGKLHLPDAELCKEVAQRRMPEYRTEEAAAPTEGHHERAKRAASTKSGRGGQE